MKRGRNTSADAAELRRKAKARLRAAATKGAPAPTEAGTQRLLHELQVHQVELEMQNEELCKSRAEVEAGLERYTELFDFAPVGYMTLGRDGTIHTVNLAAAGLLGVERARLAGRPFGVFVYEPDRAGFDSFLEKVFSNRSKAACEVALLNEGKGPLDVHITAAVSEDAQECRLMMEDITEHRRTLKKLQASEQQLQHALDATAEGVWDWNIRTGEVVFSRNWKTTLGYSPEEVPDRVEFWESIVHPEDLPLVRQALDDHFAGRTPLYVCENRLRMKSGEYRANLDRGKVVEWDASGEPVRMVGTDTDIREHRNTLNELLQAKNNIEAIFDASRQAVFLMEPDGTVVGANAETARRLDFRVEDLVGKSVFDFLPADVAGRRKQYAQEALRTRQPVRFEDARADRIISQVLYPVFDPQGNVIRLAVYGEDVTEQRLAEASRRESEVKYRSLFDNSLDGVLMTVPDGSIVDANPAACAMLGMSRDEVCRAGREGIVEHNATLAAGLRERERTGSATAELTFVRKDGSTFIGETSSVITLDPYGARRSFVIVRDVTERVRVEQALRESEASYRRIVETANEGIWSMGGDHRTTFVNRRMAALLGYAPEEMIGLRVDAFMFAEDLEDHSAKMAIRAKGEGSVYERRFRRKDGRELWTIVSATALKDAEGNFAGSFAMFTDVTERRQAELSLLESELRYRIVADNTYDWECWLSPEGKFLYSSPSCERITGYTAGDFLRRAGLMREIVHPDDRMTWDAHRCEAARGQRAVAFEFRIIRADSETRWVEHICQPVFDPAGKYLGSRASNRDVTERKRGEEALRQYEIMVASSSDAISLVGPDYVYKTVNTTLMRRTGLPRNQIVGRAVAKIMGAEVFEKIIRPRFDRALAGETVAYAEWFEFPALGRRFYEVTYAPCLNHHSEIIGIVVLSRDATARKEAGETLARSEGLLKHTQSLAKVGGWEWDLQAQTMSWTEETYRLHDLAPEEVAPGSAEHISRSLACYDEPDRLRILEAFRRCAEEGERYDYEVPFTTAKGRRFWVRTIAEAVWGGGKIVKVVGNLLDITERKQSETELLQSQMELRDLYLQLQNAREEERRRISREIHDELGQNITALQIDLAWLKKRVDPGRPELLDKLDAMNHLAESTLAAVRRVSAELRPGILDALGLTAAVDWLVRDFEKRSEILCSLLIEPEEIEVEQNLATDVFRVLQEALTNVARHARASSLQVTLRQNEDMLELEVADDGIGISEKEISRPDSLGLLGIRERLLVHGGDIALRRLPGKGSCLSATIPTRGKEGLK